LGSTVKARFTLDEDRLLIFHPEGNKVIEWDSVASRLKGRNMGMKRAYIKTVDVSGAGDVIGRYVYAIEKCYQKNGGDLLCSGVNRLIHRLSTTNPGEYARTGLIDNIAPVITLSAANFFTKVEFSAVGYTSAIPSDLGKTVNFSVSGAVGTLKEYDNTERIWWVDITSGTPTTADSVTIATGTGAGTTISALDLAQQDSLWTHLKLYRSKNLLPNTTDPDNIVEPAGTEDDMWHIATITKAEMEASGLNSIATSVDESLPPGNASIRAGTVGESFQIEDDNLDDSLISVAPVDALELLPVPACYLGTYHADRIWTGRINESAWDNGVAITDDTKSNIYYSPQDKLYYKEQSRTDFFKETGKDGQTLTVLNQFERDLFISKEDRTMRLPDGDVSLTVEVTDHDQGIKDDNFFLFVPELGICGVTSDYSDFKIYGFDHVWRSTLNGIDISKANREATEALIPEYTDMLYLNGKVLISTTGGTMHVLNIEQKRGWSRFEFPTLKINRMIAFNGGTEGIYIGNDQYSVEFEVENLNTDVSTYTDEEAAIEGSWTTYMFRSGGGRHVLEHEHLSIMAQLSYDMSGAAYVNGTAWPTLYIPNPTDFYPPPSYNPEDAHKDREYKLFIEPQTIGTFKWNRMIGNFLHYVMVTRAPFVIKSHRLACIVDEDGNRVGNFDPYQDMAHAAGWLDSPFSLVLVDSLSATDTVTDAISNTDTYTERT
jgi:hypothetical protein